MSDPLSARARGWDTLRRGCDVLVIGGGITGAGVVLDAASRGYRVVLVERGDYASGTSSRSTKLIHGGLRYLPHWQVGLVSEALHERERLRRLAPHLVSPLPFIVPLYRETRRPLGIGIPMLLRPLTPFAVRIGLWGYDVLSRSDLRHRRLTASQAEAAFPSLRTDTLQAAFLYYDAATDDVRLAHAVLSTARRLGATTLNYVEALEIHPGPPLRVALLDRLGGSSMTIEARHVVNAAGIWAEEVASRTGGGAGFRIERSKGIHLVLEAPRGLRHALVIPETDDGRLAFAVPWRGRLVLGTTDESYGGDPDAPVATSAEAAYLLDHLNRYLIRPLRVQDVIAAYAGLRPLVRRGDARSAALSRSHEVVEHGAGLISIIGGKLTTYRQMAEDTVDALVRQDGRRTPCRTRSLVLDGGDGSREASILELAAANPSLAQPLVDGLPTIAAEVVYACRAEQLVSLADFMIFRSRLATLDRDHGREAVGTVAAVMAAELGWSGPAQAAQIAVYEEALDRETAFMREWRREAPQRAT